MTFSGALSTLRAPWLSRCTTEVPSDLPQVVPFSLQRQGLSLFEICPISGLFAFVVQVRKIHQSSLYKLPSICLVFILDEHCSIFSTLGTLKYKQVIVVLGTQGKVTC